MTEILTIEEQNMLGNYHLNLARNYVYEILEQLNSVNKIPDLNYIEETIESFKREIEIAKHYKPTEKVYLDTDEDNENNR